MMTETPTYTIEPWIGAESSAAWAEGCLTYAISLTRPGRRGVCVGSFETAEELDTAVARARREPAYLVELLLASYDLLSHAREAERADHDQTARRLRERLALAEPAASDLGGRVVGALAGLHTAGELMRANEPTDAWLAVVRAADTLERPGGLTQGQAAEQAADYFERWINAEAHDGEHRLVGVVTCSWDEQTGCWYVECRAAGLASIWGVGVTAEGAEMMDET